VVYLIDPNTEKVLCLDQDVVPGLLEGHPELLDSYSQIDGKHAKRSAAIVFPLLVQSGFIICDMISGDNQRWTISGDGSSDHFPEKNGKIIKK
jgi:hypothetical protein